MTIGVCRYRKKPIVIEAIQLRWDNWCAVCDFVSKEAFGGGVDVPGRPQDIGLKINTLEGPHLAVEGDYIIKGIHGEFYPCKPDIFEKTYEYVGKVGKQ